MRGIAWCFTINNFTEEDLKQLDYIKRNSGFWVWEEEVAPNTGTRHIQGYIEFRQDRRLNAIKKDLPRAHLEIAKGSWVDNLMYCTKDKTWECSDKTLGRAADLMREKEEDLKIFTRNEALYICEMHILNEEVQEEYPWEWWVKEAKKRKDFGIEQIYAQRKRYIYEDDNL